MSAIATSRPATASTASAAVTLDHIVRGFGRAPVLAGLSLDIPAGQFLAIVGRSGSGKSTLLRLLCGLDRPDTGRILFDNAPIRPGVARMMFQEPRLLPWASVLDNVTVGLSDTSSRRESRARALAALETVGLGGRAQDWPGTLSGGQKQRVALARALVSRPGLLLLDEPLGALDALTRLEMQDLLASACRARNVTAVLVTHDVPEAVRLADRILLLERGTVTLDVRNPAPHPRRARSVGSAALEEQILARLMAG